MADESPHAQWVYRSVTFNVADEDVAIEHEFQGVDPDSEIRWVVSSLEGAALIYRPLAGSRPWTASTIFLRASAPCRARLILSVEHQ